MIKVKYFYLFIYYKQSIITTELLSYYNGILELSTSELNPECEEVYYTVNIDQVSILMTLYTQFFSLYRTKRILKSKLWKITHILYFIACTHLL